MHRKIPKLSLYSGVALLTTALSLHAQTTPKITTIAGDGVARFGGDGGDSLQASFNLPWFIHVDKDGNLLVADRQNNRIRRITRGSNPTITTIAGNGNTSTPRGEGVSPTAVSINEPFAAVDDGNGNIYIADTLNHCIRKVTSGISPIITTVAGTCGFEGFSGDGGDPKNALMELPSDLAFDKNGNLFFIDLGNARIRKITFGSNSVMTTIAGTGDARLGGDGGDPRDASMINPQCLVFDSAGNLYFSDENTRRIRKITFGNNPVITTVAGNGGSFNIDDGNPLHSALLEIHGLAFDASDHLFVVDSTQSRISKITFGDNPVITTIAGSGSGFSGDGGDPLQASFAFPTGVAVDPDGNLYVSDSLNERIRVITGVATPKANYAKNISLSFANTQLTFPGSTNLVVSVTGMPTPTGTVDIYDGTTKLTTAYLQGDGKAYWYIYPGLDAGAHQISAKYSGDGKNPAGQSAPVTINVAPVAVNFGIACWSASPSTYSCTVNVSSNAGAALGSINYSLDSNPAVSLPLSWGNAQFTLAPGTGSHSLSIQYPQQGNFAASQVNTQSFTTK